MKKYKTIDLESVFNEKGITCNTCEERHCRCFNRNEDGSWATTDSNVNWFAIENTNKKRRTKICIGGKYVCDLKDIKKSV